MNVLSVVAEVIRIGASVLLPNKADLLKWELEEIKKFREELERGKPSIGKEYPVDLRFDVARTRLQRFTSAFNDYKEKPTDENMQRVERLFKDLKDVYVCPGCEEIYNYIDDLLKAVKEDAEVKVEEVSPIIESYIEGLLFSIEATNVMKEKWGFVKPLEELSAGEKEFLRKEVEKRLIKEVV